MNSPTEPSGDLRELASMLWQTYVALTSVGFSEDQALKIIAIVIRSGGQSD